MEDIWGAPKEIAVATFKDTDPNVYVARAEDCIRRGDYQKSFMEFQYALLMGDYNEHYVKELTDFCNAIPDIDDCAESFIDALGLISLESRNELQLDSIRKMLLGYLEDLCNLYVKKSRDNKKAIEGLLNRSILVYDWLDWVQIDGKPLKQYYYQEIRRLQNIGDVEACIEICNYAVRVGAFETFTIGYDLILNSSKYSYEHEGIWIANAFDYYGDKITHELVKIHGSMNKLTKRLGLIHSKWYENSDYASLEKLCEDSELFYEYLQKNENEGFNILTVHGKLTSHALFIHCANSMSITGFKAEKQLKYYHRFYSLTNNFCGILVEIALDAEDRHVFSSLLKILVSTIIKEYKSAELYWVYSLGLQGKYWVGLGALLQAEAYNFIITYQDVIAPLAFRVAEDGERAISEKNEEGEYKRWLAIGFAARLKVYIADPINKNKQQIFDYFELHSYEDADYYGIGAHDLLSSSDLFTGALLLQEYATKKITDIKKKVDHYILAMCHIKQAGESGSFSISDKRIFDKAKKRLVKITWKYRSIVGKDYLEKVYNDMDISYRPPNTMLRVAVGVICLIAFLFGLSEYSNTGINDLSIEVMVISGFGFLFNIKPRFAFTIGFVLLAIGFVYMAFLSWS